MILSIVFALPSRGDELEFLEVGPGLCDGTEDSRRTARRRQACEVEVDAAEARQRQERPKDVFEREL